MPVAAEVYAEIQPEDKDTLQFDERGVLGAGNGLRLRIAASATSLYVSGSVPPGPWYRIKRAKRGLYRIPRSSVTSVEVLRNRTLPALPFMLGALYWNGKDRSPFSLANMLFGAVLIALLIYLWFFTRRFGVKLYTPDGFFYSVPETAHGIAKVGEGIAWAERVREGLRAGGWPVATN